MTAQIPDTLLLQDRILSIVGVNGQGLFDPVNYDLRPFPRITSCWRGYVCEYMILSSSLLLNKLQINLGMGSGNPHELVPAEGSQIGGIKPFFTTDLHELFNNTYHELHLPVNFTGGLLAADDFIHELYVHMGFHPAWKYRTVFELVLSHGRVTETRNVSQRMEQIRSEMLKSPLEPGLDATKEQIEEWVAAMFKLDYNF